MLSIFDWTLQPVTDDKGETVITIQGHIFPNNEPSRFIYAPIRTISIEQNQCVLNTGIPLRLMKG